MQAFYSLQPVKSRDFFDPLAAFFSTKPAVALLSVGADNRRWALALIRLCTGAARRTARLLENTGHNAAARAKKGLPF
jgi:hypothetical protein